MDALRGNIQFETLKKMRVTSCKDLENKLQAEDTECAKVPEAGVSVCEVKQNSLCSWDVVSQRGEEHSRLHEQ